MPETHDDHGIHIVPDVENEKLHTPTTECVCRPEPFKTIDQENGETVVVFQMWLHKKLGGKNGSGKPN